MVFHGYEFPFDIFNAKDADAYEKALETLKAKANQAKKKEDSLGGTIRTQCAIVYKFFDTLLGEELRKELFPGEDNLMTCLSTFQDFIKTVDAQRIPLDNMLAEATQQAKSTEKSAGQVADGHRAWRMVDNNG